MAQIKIGTKVKYQIMDYSFIKPKHRLTQGGIVQIIDINDTPYFWIKRNNSDKEDFRSIGAITIVKIQSKLK